MNVEHLTVIVRPGTFFSRHTSLLRVSAASFIVLRSLGEALKSGYMTIYIL